MTDYDVMNCLCLLLTGGLLPDTITGMAVTKKVYRVAADLFDQELTKAEQRALLRLDTPNKIQLFLDDLVYASETIYRSPLRVLHELTCQCFDGAVFAAALLYRLGNPALIIDLLPNSRDDDHVLSLFRQNRRWGAVAKSNFTGLRFREPIYRDVRELVMSYFEHYYNVYREKTLRGYTLPLDLKAFDRRQWMTNDDTMELIAQQLDRRRRFSLLARPMIRQLSLVDKRSSQAGLYGANKAGLSIPSRRVKS